MAVIAQDSTRFSALVKHEYEPQLSYCRDAVTVNDAAQTLKVGAVLGKVTATGKYKLCTSGAVDGSQNPVAVLIADVMGNSNDIALPATTDTKVIALTRGPVILADAALQLGTGITAAAVKAALAPLGIIVEAAL
jgi:hypothetical protein